MCGVLAVMLVGIFTKLGLEKAHRRQRKPSPDDPLGSLENRTGLEDHVLLEPGLGYSVEAGPPGQGDLLSSMLPSSSVPELMTISKLLSLLRQCRVPGDSNQEQAGKAGIESPQLAGMQQNHNSQPEEQWPQLSVFRKPLCLSNSMVLDKCLCHEVLGFLSSEYCALNWGSECHNLGALQTGSPKANHLHELLCGIYLPSHPSGLSKS
ncbi:uncharacterized protein LOC122478352 [Prionailurus bengalensis]|uniref:uncharacterized protein LOC122478352 n=1 Tax=Prionailurus bengalensis TaxID=37029 RepID=UPI001CA83E25|nr:uncharacterized protein LOC122478352 [Prionailurus bengalensis]